MARPNEPKQSPHWLFTGWRGGAVAVFCVLMVLTGLVQAEADLEKTGVLTHGLATRFGTEGTHPAPEGAGWIVVDGVVRGGGLERAGVRSGDAIRVDDQGLINVNLPEGTPVKLTVRRGGRSYPVTMTITASRASAFVNGAPSYLIVACMIMSMALGVVVLLRGWGSLPSLSLGLGLVGFISVFEAIPFLVWTSPIRWLGLVALAMRTACFAGITLFPLFLYQQAVGPLGRWWWRVMALTSIVLVAALAFSRQVPANLANDFGQIIHICSFIFTSSACWWSWRGWRDAQGNERSRFAILLFALGVLLTSLSALVLRLYLANLGSTVMGLAQIITIFGGFLLFPLVLTYAVLRHRVVDLGFVLNRTVVYGSVSAILLGCFGLIEWGAEHLLPEEWVKASAWIDAGAAVAVYLAFHQVHSAVEQQVEHLFFRHWQANESKLRRFVASAAHYEDDGALAQGFATELGRFGGGAKTALYRLQSGVLVNVAGGWGDAPAQLPSDDPAFALMRAERKPLDLSDVSSALPGILALPMLDHGALTGLVLMDLKNGEALYRPDEVEVLGWAVHEVGMAFAALHARSTDAEVSKLTVQITELRALVGRLAPASQSA